jgi:peptidylamidoglycolate lyase
MKRKHFIRQSSLAAAAVLLSPSILSSAKKEDIILGHGNKRYRINTKWSKADDTG